jgi:hypothetical protein
MPNPPCPDCHQPGRRNGKQPDETPRYRCINPECSRSGYVESPKIRGRKKQVLTIKQLEVQRLRKRERDRAKQQRYRAKKKLTKGEK